MKLELYCIRDKLVAFDQPRVSPNERAAVRDFSDGLDQISALRASDYDLYRVGVFDSEKGTIVPETVPVLVCTGSSVVGVKNEKTV